MAEKRKAEGIALLSVYNDEEEEEEEEEDMDVDVDEDNLEADDEAQQEEQRLSTASPASSLPSPALASPLAPQPEAGASPLGNSPLPVDAAGSVALGIVDYAHDDAMMSPEPEEGEITVTDRAIVVSETTIDTFVYKEVLQLDSSVTSTTDKDSPSENDSLEESTLKIAADFISEKSSQHMHDENGYIQSEATQIDPLLEFLPSAPSLTCSEELQTKFTKYLQMKSQGKSFNKELRGSKGYRNPDFLQRAVRYQGIDQIGSCFKKDIFDPHGYDATDFYDALVAQQRREMEKKEQEKKQSQRVDFVRGGVQVSQVTPADARTKSTVQLVASQKSGPSNNVGNTVQAVTSSSNGSGKADVRASKKSKWDKVETIGKALPGFPTGAQHAIAAASAHVALMSAAGAGYASFAQQKRREAEGKLKSAEKFSGFSAKSEKKFDKSQ